MPYEHNRLPGAFYDEPKIKVKGFENQRSDSPIVTAELQEKIIEMILTGADFQEVSEYIQSTIDEINQDSGSVRKFALPGSLNRELEDYTNTQITRAARYSNKHLGYEFGEGDDPFVYLVNDTPPELPQTDVLALRWNEDIPEGFELDKEAIIERAVRKPISKIIGEVGWEFNEIRSGKKQQTKDLTTGGENPFV